MNFFRIPSEIISVRPETVFTVWGFEVTNSVITGAVLTVLMFLFLLILRARLQYKPGTVQNLMEIAVEGIVYLLEQIAGTRERAERLLPLIGTIFIYFMIANLITLVPGVSSFTYNGIALFRGPTNDFNMTFSVALGVVILSQIMSVREFGLLGHLGKYFKFKELWQGFRQGIGKGMIALIDFLIGLLDIVSEFAKVFSLSLRLFGNMFAGEVLMALLLGAFALIVPSVWLAMNLLVGIIQAIVFGALSAAYYVMAVQHMEQEQIT